MFISIRSQQKIQPFSQPAFALPVQAWYAAALKNVD
jgi:hypothetical protein